MGGPKDGRIEASGEETITVFGYNIGAGELPCRFTTGLAFAPTDFTIFIKRGPPTWLRH